MSQLLPTALGVVLIPQVFFWGFFLYIYICTLETLHGYGIIFAPKTCAPPFPSPPTHILTPTYASTIYIHADISHL